MHGVHFSKCGAQLAAIKVLLDLAKLDRTHDLGRVAGNDTGVNRAAAGAHVSFGAIAAATRRSRSARFRQYRLLLIEIPLRPFRVILTTPPAGGERLFERHAAPTHEMVRRSRKNGAIQFCQFFKKYYPHTTNLEAQL